MIQGLVFVSFLSLSFIEDAVLKIPICLRGLVAFAFLLLAPSIQAQRGELASLLLFPKYDSGFGQINLVSVTNVDNGPYSPVDVTWRYTVESSCSVVTKLETLNSNDNLTVMTSSHAGVLARGYLEVFATNSSQQPIVHNQLMGTSMIIDAFGGDSYTIEPYSLKAIGTEVAGSLTDLNGNGRLDLNGNEYDSVGESHMFPRFMGQSGIFNSQFVLVDLSGGQGYSTTVAGFAYNDNEEVFSFEHEFSCWEEVDLLAVSFLFDNGFLQTNTNHDPNEVFGVPAIETGWVEIEGVFSAGMFSAFQDPAIVALMIEQDSFGTSTSTHPAFRGSNTSGSLIPDGDAQSAAGAAQ